LASLPSRILHSLSDAQQNFDWLVARIGAGLATLVRSRTVYGTVLATGALNTGIGFTPSKIGAGRYKIVFDTPFILPPVLLGTAVGAAGTPLVVQIDNGTTWNNSQVGVLITSAGAATDAPFAFEAKAPV
jgi:hypothetical protein